eukprot:Sdes_comp20482_c0_seq1m14817
MGIESKIQSLIQNNAVVIFSKTYCPYCRKAKELFSRLGWQYVAFELDTESDGASVQEELFRLTQQKTVPNVFVKGKHIGGCDATYAAEQKGELQALYMA